MPVTTAPLTVSVRAGLSPHVTTVLAVSSVRAGRAPALTHHTWSTQTRDRGEMDKEPAPGLADGEGPSNSTRT